MLNMKVRLHTLGQLNLPRSGGHSRMDNKVARTKRKRRTFSATFRKRAISLVKDSGKSVASVAKQLDVSDKTLYSWLHASADNNQGDAKTSESSSEIAELEKELKLLKQRCAKLRLAAAYLAEDGPA